MILYSLFSNSRGMRIQGRNSFLVELFPCVSCSFSSLIIREIMSSSDGLIIAKKNFHQLNFEPTNFVFPGCKISRMAKHEELQIMGASRCLKTAWLKTSGVAGKLVKCSVCLSSGLANWQLVFLVSCLALINQITITVTFHLKARSGAVANQNEHGAIQMNCKLKNGPFNALHDTLIWVSVQLQIKGREFIR